MAPWFAYIGPTVSWLVVINVLEVSVLISLKKLSSYIILYYTSRGCGAPPGNGALGCLQVFCIDQQSIGQINSNFGESLFIYIIFLSQVAKGPSQVVLELTKKNIYCGNVGFEGSI